MDKKIKKQLKEIKKTSFTAPDLEETKINNLLGAVGEMIKPVKNKKSGLDKKIKKQLKEIKKTSFTVPDLEETETNNMLATVATMIKNKKILALNNLIDELNETPVKVYKPKSTDESKYDKYKKINPEPELIKGDLLTKRKILSYQIYNLKNSLMEKINNPKSTKEEIKQIKKSIKFYDKELLKLSE